MGRDLSDSFETDKSASVLGKPGIFKTNELDNRALEKRLNMITKNIQ